MTACVLFLSATALACAQTTIQTYVFDAEGNRTRGPEVDVRGDVRTELLPSINGRSVPLEKVEERVIRDDGTSKLIERTIQRFDQTGHLAQTERVSEERTRQADGGSQVRATTYRTDVNGNMQLFERSSTEIRKTGEALTSDVVVERPSINGSLEKAEKRFITDDQTPSHDSRSTVIYRRDDNGGFHEAVKETVNTQTDDGRSVQNSARYAVGSSGRLELYEQAVRTTVKRKDGTESTVVDLYSSERPGSSNASGDRTPKLNEEQLIERRSANGQVYEVLSMREPSASDPNRLGTARRIKETVCTGKCED